MDNIVIEATEKAYTTAKEARAAGRIPLIYYGKGVENRSFSVDYQEFRRAYEKGGRSTIMQLVPEDKKEYPILVQDIQYEPISDDIMHIDVMAVEMGKLITTEVPLVLVGVSAAVKDEGGMLSQNKDKVQVECLPKDLIQEIEVDITSLVDFHTSITVGDLKVPDTITILDAAEINVATVAAPREVEEEAPVPAEGEAPAEGAEGEAPAEGAEGEAPAEGEKKKE